MLSSLPLTFPNFNIYSTPLLVLVLQGVIFAVLLVIRYTRKKRISDLLLAAVLIITCYHRITYTIGFMDWYDTFRNTKINYYLVSFSLLLAPLIYFYVKSVTLTDFRFRKKHIWHFIPAAFYILIKTFIYIYDSSLPGFDDTQNGYLVENFEWKILAPFHAIFSKLQMILYLAFSFQLLYNYRRKIEHYFSNVFKLQLNWLRNFLLVYSFLFVYSLFQIIIDTVIVDLSWTQEWWYHFFSALVIIYVGVHGYFAETFKLLETTDIEDISSKHEVTSTDLSSEILERKNRLAEYIQTERPYLNPDITLIELAKELKMTRSELSEVINSGYQLNFNDFINQFRVENVKQMISEGKHHHLSFLGIAFESGFNSKATFNRVFKKFTTTSPTEYIKSNK